jgi:hypothetical protein
VAPFLRLDPRPFYLLRTILSQQGTETQFGWFCTIETTSVRRPNCTKLSDLPRPADRGRRRAVKIGKSLERRRGVGGSCQSPRYNPTANILQYLNGLLNLLRNRAARDSELLTQ